MVGAMLLLIGLSLSEPEHTDAPIAGKESDASGSNPGPMSAEAPALTVVEETPPEPLWRNFTVGDGDNLSLIFNRAGFSDTDLYRVARDNDDRSLKRTRHNAQRYGQRVLLGASRSRKA